MPCPIQKTHIKPRGWCSLGNSGGAKCSLHDTGEINVHALLPVQPLIIIIVIMAVVHIWMPDLKKKKKKKTPQQQLGG